MLFGKSINLSDCSKNIGMEVNETKNIEVLLLSNFLFQKESNDTLKSLNSSCS